MARLPIPAGTGKTRDRLFGQYRPEIGRALNALSEAIERDTLLSTREREFVRIRIALINNCHS